MDLETLGAVRCTLQPSGYSQGEAVTAHMLLGPPMLQVNTSLQVVLLLFKTESHCPQCNIWDKP